MWKRADVSERVTSRKTIAHPEVGRLTLDCDLLTVAGRTCGWSSIRPSQVHRTPVRSRCSPRLAPKRCRSPTCPRGLSSIRGSAGPGRGAHGWSLGHHPSGRAL
ncbi:hypothetical protein [Micromonospora sp. DR5-3]|uniref:MmyB family transcriptional regulator n=1 Tax=Micromonospora sp. DR5-3 TaxID=2992129 RepID=UPI0039B6F69A